MKTIITSCVYSRKTTSSDIASPNTCKVKQEINWSYYWPFQNQLEGMEVAYYNPFIHFSCLFKNIL